MDDRTVDDADTADLSDLGRALRQLELDYAITSFRLADGPVEHVDEDLRRRWLHAWETYQRRGRALSTPQRPSKPPKDHHPDRNTPSPGNVSET